MANMTSKEIKTLKSGIEHGKNPIRPAAEIVHQAVGITKSESEKMKDPIYKSGVQIGKEKKK